MIERYTIGHVNLQILKGGAILGRYYLFASLLSSHEVSKYRASWRA
jgi:hypothetical protein